MKEENMPSLVEGIVSVIKIPLWDGDEVPNYLKMQILEARKTLRVLKILEIQEHRQDEKGIFLR